MRTNALKRKIAAGQRVCGVLTEINSPELVELFGFLGFDFVFIDGQHGGLTVETGREMIRAADHSGMTSIVRVPRNDPSVSHRCISAASRPASGGTTPPTPAALMSG